MNIAVDTSSVGNLALIAGAISIGLASAGWYTFKWHQNRSWRGAFAEMKEMTG